MRQMPPVIQPHPHHRIPRLQQREIRRHIRLRPAVRLHVGVFRPEQLLRPLNRQRLHRVRLLAAPIIPPPRIPLGILVADHARPRLQHRPAGIILRRDQHNRLALPPILIRQRPGHLRVQFRQRRHNKLLIHPNQKSRMPNPAETIPNQVYGCPPTVSNRPRHPPIIDTPKPAPL